MNHKLITDRLFYQKVLSIMLPVALQQAINMGVNMLDTMMLEQMGEVQISASSLANQYYNFFTIFCMGIIGGSSVLAAQYWGARDLNKVQQTFCLAIRMALLFSVTFALLTWLFPAQIMRIYTPDPAVIEQGIRYLRITTCVFVIHGTSLVAEQLMRSVGQARLGLVVSSISFVVNLIANYIFIFGKFGAPRMEIAGAALGTLFARIAEFLVTFGYIFFRDRSLHFRFSHLFRKVERSLLMNYLRLGVPVLVSDGLLGLGSNIVSIILGHMGAAVVATNAICQVIDRLFTVVIQGIANASSIVTGHTIGEGDTERAMQQGYTFYLLSVAFGLIAVVMVLACGPLTIRVYSLTEETVIITEQMMRAYAVIVFFQCIQSVMTKGVLRGGGDTKFLMKADILFMWLVSIPLGCIGGLVLGWPAWLTILCLRIDYVIKSVWCVTRLKSGKWIRSVEDASLPARN